MTTGDLNYTRFEILLVNHMKAKSTTFVSGLVSASGLGLLYLICLAGTPDMLGLQGAGLCWYDGQLLQLGLALLGWIDIL